MTDNLLTELQTLFCKRASLMHAQSKLANNPGMDCQLRVKFADGSNVVLKLSRTDIENIIDNQTGSVEYNIQEALAGLEE